MPIATVHELIKNKVKVSVMATVTARRLKQIQTAAAKAVGGNNSTSYGTKSEEQCVQ